MNIDILGIIRDPATTDLSDIVGAGHAKTGEPYEEINGTWTFPYDPEVTDPMIIARVKLRLTTTPNEEFQYVEAYKVIQGLTATANSTITNASTQVLTEEVKKLNGIVARLIPLVLTKFQGLV